MDKMAALIKIRVTAKAYGKSSFLFSKTGTPVAHCLCGFPAYLACKPHADCATRQALFGFLISITFVASQIL
jgi:hypothetical protein